MRKYWQDFVLAVLAGMCIGIGGVIFLSVESRVLGAFLFTGKVGYALSNPPSYLLFLANIWLGNLVGTFAVAALLRLTRIGAALTQRAAALCDTKLADGALSVFILAIFCNVLMYIAVDGFKTNQHELGKYLGLFFGVVVFILCGFEHCVANMFYFSMAGVWDLHTLCWLLIMTGGNAVGGLLIPFFQR